MTTTTTDLRYGRRGGGWVPAERARETMHPHLFKLRPCPDFGCAGRVQVPLEPPTQPYVSTCDGMFPHTFDITPLAPFTARQADHAS